EDFQLSKCDQGPQRAGIFRLIGRPRLRLRAICVFLSAAGQWILDEVSIGAHHDGMDARHRQHITGFWSKVPVFPGCQHLSISLPAMFGRGIGSLSIWAMIDESPDGDTR